MPAKPTSGIPRTAKDAKKRGYTKAEKVNHAKLSTEAKKEWAYVRHGRSRIVCYYNPKTGNYDDCHEEAE